jgi:hypothetical protein
MRLALKEIIGVGGISNYPIYSAEKKMEENEMRKKITGVIAGLLMLAILADAQNTVPSAGDTGGDKSEKKDGSKLAETLRPTLTDAEKVNLAEPILERILQGVNKNDYAVYSDNFSKGLKAQITEKEFKVLNDDLIKKIGEYKSRKFLGILSKKLVDIYLWKAKFAKTDEDFMIRLFLIEDEGKLKVFSFSITPF